MENSSDNSVMHDPDLNSTMEKSDLYCGEMTQKWSEDWLTCQYWCEGVLFSVIGGIGLVGNLISIFVLITK